MMGAESFQLALFFECFFMCFGLGLLFDFSNLICFLANKNYAARCVLYFLGFLIFFACLYLFALYKNCGVVRWYFVLAAFSGLLLERFSLGKIIEKTFNLCYHLFERFKLWIKEKLKSCKSGGKGGGK